MSFHHYMHLLLLNLICWLPLTTLASKNIYEDYESIVSRLSSNSNVTSIRSFRTPFQHIQIHTGVGLVSSRLSLGGAHVTSETGFLKGVEATLGIDLFSQFWLAEGSVRSFSEEQLTHSRVSLKEFDLKFIRKTPIGRQAHLRIGFGIAARYLDYIGTPNPSNNLDSISPSSTTQVSIRKRIKTPASILLVGMTARLTNFLSLGTELSVRSPMIDETIEGSAVQGSLRLDLHY